MWNSLKNDPIIKTTFVLILGILGFGFTFNLIFGSASGYNMNHIEGMNANFTFENSIRYIVAILYKLLVAALVITAVIAMIKFISKLLDGEAKQVNTSFRNDPIIKILVTLGALVLIVSLTFPLLGAIIGMGQNNSINNGHNMIGNGMSVNNSINGFSFNFNSLLETLLKVLFFLSVIGIVIGFVMYLVQNYSSKFKESFKKLDNSHNNLSQNTICSQCNSNIKGNYKFCPECGSKTSLICNSCKEVLNPKWKCCPSCGASIDDTIKDIPVILNKEVTNNESSI